MRSIGTLLTVTLVLAGCGGSEAARGVGFATLPPGALAPAWSRPLVAQAAPTLFAALSTQGASALVSLRLHGPDVTAFFTDAGQERLARGIPGLVPRASERRWQVLHSLGGTGLAGWCARGVRVVEGGGPEGFRGRALTVDRLLVVGEEPGGYWGMWLEGLVYTAEGWRFLPSVPWGDAVETPRRDHADVDLWDCDMGQRPARVPSGRAPTPAVSPAPTPAG